MVQLIVCTLGCQDRQFSFVARLASKLDGIKVSLQFTKASRCSYAAQAILISVVSWIRNARADL